MKRLIWRAPQFFWFLASSEFGASNQLLAEDSWPAASLLFSSVLFSSFFLQCASIIGRELLISCLLVQSDTVHCPCWTFGTRNCFKFYFEQFVTCIIMKIKIHSCHIHLSIKYQRRLFCKSVKCVQWFLQWSRFMTRFTFHCCQDCSTALAWFVLHNRP